MIAKNNVRAVVLRMQVVGFLMINAARREGGAKAEVVAWRVRVRVVGRERASVGEGIGKGV
jgi:hypothetical protein